MANAGHSTNNRAHLIAFQIRPTELTPFEAIKGVGGSGGGGHVFSTESFMMRMDSFYSELLADFGYWIDKH